MMSNENKIEILKKIDLFIRGELSQGEIDDLWKEFLQYPEYYEWFETELHLRSLIRKGKKPNFTDSSGDSAKFYALGGFRPWLFAAAAALLIAIGIQFFSIDQQQALQRMAISSIEYTELMGAEVQRSEEEEAEEIEIAINQALAIAYDDQPALAIHHFGQILDQSPSAYQRSLIEMNLGILHYNQGDYSSAKSHLLSITEMDNLRSHTVEKSWWYLGNTYLNLGDFAEARDAVFKVYEMDGRFKSPALELLNRLDTELGNISSEAPAPLER